MLLFSYNKYRIIKSINIKLNETKVLLKGGKDDEI